MKIKVFLFHRVNPERDLLWDPMDPLHFRKVIEYLNRKFDIFKLEDMILYPQNYNGAKKPLAAVVFDDGYRDFIEYALPILKEYNTPASMYVITDSATYGTPPWTYVLDHTFQNSNILKANFELSGLPEEFKVTGWQNNNERIAYGKRLKPFLKQLSHNERESNLDALRLNFDDIIIPSDLFMSWNNIKEIYDAGVEIGSHTVTHPLLGTIESDAILKNELNQSALTIQKHLGKFPLTISYPVGSYNEKVQQLSKEAGYLLGLAVNQHSYDSAKHNRFAIPRIELYNESMFKTKLRINEVVYKVKSLLKR